MVNAAHRIVDIVGPSRPGRPPYKKSIEPGEQFLVVRQSNRDVDHNAYTHYIAALIVTSTTALLVWLKLPLHNLRKVLLTALLEPRLRVSLKCETEDIGHESPSVGALGSLRDHMALKPNKT